MEQVYRARYYPSGCFMEAELGSAPSYTWWGIWEARWVVRRGMRWRVGNGENIKVWSNPWIPGTQSRKILSPKGDSNSELEVGALINPITRSWNPELVMQLFLPFEQERVMNIPLSPRMPDDIVCLDLQKDGRYSVRV